MSDNLDIDELLEERTATDEVSEIKHISKIGSEMVGTGIGANIFIAPHHGHLRAISAIDTQSVPKFEEQSKDVTFSFGPDVFFKNWENVANFPARLINAYDEVILLEILIDKENRIYQEREFRRRLFEEFELKQGGLFYLRYFERGNESRCTVLDGAKLVNVGDFPTKRLGERFRKSSFLKKK